MGLGASVTSEINHAPDVVDLLISMCYCALASGRGDKIFLDSFPSDFIFNSNKDFDKMVRNFFKISNNFHYNY